jgi:hydrogenase expression/formation protein HypD
MKFLEEFRDISLAKRLIQQIRQTASRRWTIMEVCGGQTHSILRHGIDAELHDVVELIHGPGCPVCVTSIEAIDFAQTLCLQPNVVLATFGDMLRVSGSRQTLMQTRSIGGHVKTVYSPLDAVRLARENADQHVVFFAVGFETTVPATAIAIRLAEQQQLDNFSVIAAHVRVLPAMEQIATSPESTVEAFLAAGHVCSVTGYQPYQAFVDRFGLPVVVTGFEPVDLLEGLRLCIEHLESGRSNVVNAYTRVTSKAGNVTAQQIIESVYQTCDQVWRGLGRIGDGGFEVRQPYHHFDARRRFAHLAGQAQSEVEPSSECRSGEVLCGTIKPIQCGAFATRCSPESPLGAPMVSSEGACAAYYRYVTQQPITIMTNDTTA